ncbi:transmembrane protein 41B-like [Lytechinus variegatus]|uniref:transmembrane protein 41B-like n=1 Tax=Lytechinus variegatus TaxID=7654 RepID=UPI001BB2695C|nr:transmembrane protein 41B-like [Lytechinus variegatus]
MEQTRYNLRRKSREGQKMDQRMDERLDQSLPTQETNDVRVIDESVNVPSVKTAESSQVQTSRPALIVLLIFFLSVCVMGLVYWSFPEIDEDDIEHIKLPRKMDDAKDLGKVLSRYNEQNSIAVMAAFFITYIFLQTFAIPGSIFLSILSGFLFPFFIALFLVCLCSAIGASNCYMISYFVGVQLVQKYIPERVEKWSATVARHREHLLNYIIFLRITPFLPNWFINITSPILEVSIWPFFVGTFLGVAPPSFIAIQAGTTLYQLTHAGDALSWTSVIILAILAVLSILPAVFKQRLQEKFE